MKKLYSSVTGIDQGSVQLFSDFEHDGEMWSSHGDRESRVGVQFSEEFKSIPSVFITLELLDLHSGANHRTVMIAQDITRSGFEAVLRTWSDTRIARARAAWIAIGEVRGEDDWNIDDGS